MTPFHNLKLCENHTERKRKKSQKTSYDKVNKKIDII